MPRREPIRLWRRTPRPWHGMTVLPWLRLLARNHFAVSPGRIPMALAVSALAPLHSTAALAQRVRFGQALAHPADGPPPLFIIGHWRTGTTLLHELLALDPQFRCPSAFRWETWTRAPLSRPMRTASSSDSRTVSPSPRIWLVYRARRRARIRLRAITSSVFAKLPGG